MKVVGLITEYNPFHNGHLHHLNASKKETHAEGVIAVMSGHFLQRGEPAIINKWDRAKAAVLSGVDLVIEIPTLYACASAEYFAYGSVYILNALGVDALCFGSEDGSLTTIDKIAEMLLHPTEDFNNRLQDALSKGHSYPKARSMALDLAFDYKANNILGIEYLKAMKLMNSTMTPATIKRVQADYLAENLSGTIASATAIRKHANELNKIKDYVPSSTYEIMNQQHIHKEDLFLILLYKIRTTCTEDIAEISDVSEGLENKIKKAALTANSYDELIENIVSKRFTKTRVQRILIKLLLNIKKEAFIDEHPRYARILAFNDKGKKMLNKIKKTSKIPLITNINKVILDDASKKMLALDITATNMYQLLCKNTNGGQDYINKPVYIKDE